MRRQFDTEAQKLVAEHQAAVRPQPQPLPAMPHHARRHAHAATDPRAAALRSGASGACPVCAPRPVQCTLNADSRWRAREVHVNHNAASPCASEFAESGLQKTTRDGQQAQAEQLAMARQKQRREEMDMLHFSLSGARIFFRD